MPRQTVSERLRFSMNRLLKRYARGENAAALSVYSHQRPGGTKIKTQDISTFLKNLSGTGRKGLTLDDLDDISAFLRVSIGELIGVPKLKDLSGDEQRIVLAFRGLTKDLQDDAIQLLEAAAVGVPLTARNVRLSRGIAREHHVPDRPVSSADAATLLERTQTWLAQVALECRAAAEGQIRDRSVSGARPDETTDRAVVE